MSETVSPTPAGYHTVTPYLLIRGASDAIEFYAKAFDATEVMRLQGPDGIVGHAEVRIGNSHVMLADEHPDMDFLGPQSRGGTTVSLLIYVDDVDSVFAQAIDAGAEELKPLCDQFYGDRSGTVVDPWGHIWTVATRIENLAHEVIQQRFQEFFVDA
jgi:PhnB protein